MPEMLQGNLNGGNQNLGKYGLQNISPDLIAQYRKELSEGMTSKSTLVDPPQPSTAI